MSRLSVAFIRASFGFLLFGILLGLIMALPGGYSWLSNLGHGSPNIAHAHSNLLGFLMHMVAGTAYHIFPRFTGNPIKWPKVAWAHFYAGVSGTTLMILGFLLQGRMPWLLPVGAVVQVCGLVTFSVLMFTVVKPLKRLSV